MMFWMYIRDEPEASPETSHRMTETETLVEVEVRLGRGPPWREGLFHALCCRYSAPGVGREACRRVYPGRYTPACRTSVTPR